MRIDILAYQLLQKHKHGSTLFILSVAVKQAHRSSDIHSIKNLQHILSMPKIVLYDVIKLGIELGLITQVGGRYIFHKIKSTSNDIINIHPSIKPKSISEYKDYIRIAIFKYRKLKCDYGQYLFRSEPRTKKDINLNAKLRLKNDWTFKSNYLTYEKIAEWFQCSVMTAKLFVKKYDGILFEKINNGLVSLLSNRRKSIGKLKGLSCIPCESQGSFYFKGNPFKQIPNSYNLL
jgi:hypothetical protein